MKMRLILATLLALPFGVSAQNATPPEPVQIDVTAVLNTRVVTTFTNGQIVTFSDNIDGAGGIATTAAATAAAPSPDKINPHSVPDDGTFPANGDHPKVVLHFSNTDGTGKQVRRMGPADEFSFAVPPKNYAKMFLFFTSGASGPAKLHFTLTYQDGTTETRDEVCPDWWKDLDGTNPDCTYLASNLAKWGKKNKTVENDHHNILALDIHPTPGKVLTQVTVKKTHPLVCFWGATGQPAN